MKKQKTVKCDTIIGVLAHPCNMKPALKVLVSTKPYKPPKNVTVIWK